MRRLSGPALIAAGLAVGLVTACAPDPAPRRAGLEVAANFYPIEFLAQRVGGQHVHVTGLTPDGTEPHDLALDAPTLAALQEADVVVYLGSGFQPDVEDAVTRLPDSVAANDLLATSGLDLLPAPAALGKESLADNLDPHVWLDPVDMVAMSRSLAVTLADVDPAHAGDYAANQQALEADLTKLGEDYATGLIACERRTIVTSHAAFGYLADEYGLVQVAISGVSPDDEPDPATLAEITDVARSAGVSTVFFEEALPTSLAETVAQEIDADTDLLAAVEFRPEEGQDYLSVMRENLAHLRSGLDCA